MSLQPDRRRNAQLSLLLLPASAIHAIRVYDMNRQQTVAEINELTGTMRNSPSLSGLRAAIATLGVDPRRALLICCDEDEQLREHGLIVGANRRVFRWTRSTGSTYRKDSQALTLEDQLVVACVRGTKSRYPAARITWVELTDMPHSTRKFPHLEVALEMLLPNTQTSLRSDGEKDEPAAARGRCAAG
jgi:hypothetical protein